MKIFLTTLAVCVGLMIAVQPAYGQLTPKFKQSSYVNESATLRNKHITFNFFKRIKGWGWGEIETPGGKLMAVLDHLGEIMILDQDIPMRFEAAEVKRVQDASGESLVFDVKSVVVRDMLKGTSFDNWMYYPYAEPAITGVVTITLESGSPVAHLKYDLTATGNYTVRYLRGPWLKVGESSFGTEKDDAILPGVDWAINEEWTSGSDFFKDPWALRVVPHPNKVSIPLMAVSHKGDGIGLAWDPGKVVSRWFNYRSQYAQPVFASPNFVDRMNNQLMGLMIPDGTVESHENEVNSKAPFELRIGQKIEFEAELWLSKGNSVDVVADWTKRHGLPEPSAPKWEYRKALDLMAQAYNTNLWHEGRGFGVVQRSIEEAGPHVPGFLARYMNENKKSQVVKELQAKIESVKPKDTSKKETSEETRNRLVKQGDGILAIQRADGSFAFEPDGRHYRKDDFKVATSFVEPMGLDGATALDITILPAMSLLNIGKQTGEQRFLDAGRKAIDFCMPMQRPEGGDFWETPLHAANLFAAGHAAIANYKAFQQFGDPKYKAKAVYWMRTILPFTHLWEPAKLPMLYNTKPVLSSSDWYFANWVRDHVQWEVLAVFVQSVSEGIRWEEVDPEIDWLKFHRGITNAAIRWMNVHTDNNWRPHNIPDTYERYTQGAFDYCFPDTHNSVTGNYGGMFISPSAIADNIYYLLDREAEAKKK
ncbi:MAG: hypothetical protein LBL24_09730 [Bacteroidales bacterium]|jgi:hypothetical protein|nr:hypothetical protein [Bacteroidales bacterium]